MTSRESKTVRPAPDAAFPIWSMIAAGAGLLAAIALLVLIPRAERAYAANPGTLPETVASPTGETHGYNATFNDSTRYPAPVTVDLVDTEIAAASSQAHIGVVLSGKSANTVIAFVRCTWGDGAGPTRDQTQSVFFRPGDPLRTTVACPMRRGSAGSTVRFLQANEPDGAKRGRRDAVARLVENSDALESRLGGSTAFRAPYRFAPLGRTVYQSKGAELAITDAGTGTSWSTALPHGRTQPANAETGYYGPLEMNGFSNQNGDLVLASKRLATPFKAENGSYPFLATILSGHKFPQVQFTYGSVQWVAKMPDRRGSWPALWLLPVSGWPPEIDVYEGFTFNNEWKAPSSLSANIHGGANIKRTFDRASFRLRMEDLGLSPTLTTEFHKFQVTVDPWWITIFVDDIETMRYANGFKGKRWFPLMQVAVKADRDAPYIEGSGAMVLRSMTVWRDE